MAPARPLGPPPIGADVRPRPLRSQLSFPPPDFRARSHPWLAEGPDHRRRRPRLAPRPAIVRPPAAHGQSAPGARAADRSVESQSVGWTGGAPLVIPVQAGI